MLHIIKLAVGCPSIEILKQRMQEFRFEGYGAVPTRTMPKRADEILNGGSIYRVIDGLILCRQPIIDFKSHQRPDGSKGTLILVSDDIIPVQPRPIRPFQGWRYLDPSEAPSDIGTHDTNIEDGISSLPPHLHKKLSELALI